jgi:hypothetical protein
MDYDQWYGLFQSALRLSKFELVEPEPDIEVSGSIGDSSVTWVEMMMYRQPFNFPFKMPDLHWYQNKNWLWKMMGAWFNLDLDDVEVYKLQRPHDSGNVTPAAQQDDAGRGRY